MRTNMSRRILLTLLFALTVTAHGHPSVHAAAPATSVVADPFAVRHDKDANTVQIASRTPRLRASLRPSYWESLAIHSSIQTADYVSTHHAMRAGAEEFNPLMFRGRPLPMLMAKVPITVGLSYLDFKIGRKSRRNQWVYRGVLIAGYSAIVALNAQKAGR